MKHRISGCPLFRGAFIEQDVHGGGHSAHSCCNASCQHISALITKWVSVTHGRCVRNTFLACIVTGIFSAVACYRTIPDNADRIEAEAVKSLKGKYEHVSWASHVDSITLIGVEVTDELLDDIVKLKHLTELSLIGTTITDDQLAKLTQLKELTALSLRSTLITDRGMVHLLNMKSLVLVDLSDTAVTDEGLATLAKSSQWRRVFLDRTKVTDAGVAKLQEAAPECIIQRGDY